MTTNTSTTSGSSSGLGKGAIAGISVGAVIGGLAIVGLLVWLAFFKTKKKKVVYSHQSEEELKLFPPSKPLVSLQELNALGNAKHELDGQGNAKHEAEGKGFARQELDARVISELPAQHD